MVWVLLGPLAPDIAQELGLNPAQRGLMVAVPTLAGAILRLVNGLPVDRIGPKTTGTVGQIIVLAGVFLACVTDDYSFGELVRASCRESSCQYCYSTGVDVAKK